MDKGYEERLTAFGNTAFGKRSAEVAAEPGLITTREELVEYWQLALEERGRNKSVQANIALVAARRKGEPDIDYRRPEDKPYIDIVMQFMHMDHMSERYGEEADKEWDKLAAMLRQLPEYRDPDASK